MSSIEYFEVSTDETNVDLVEVEYVKGVPYVLFPVGYLHFDEVKTLINRIEKSQQEKQLKLV